MRLGNESGAGISWHRHTSLWDEYARTIEPARQLIAEFVTLERQLSDLVNEAYGLTPDEVNLLWDSAPPRMPIPDPRGAAGQ